jgi:hypothetical protein
VSLITVTPTSAFPGDQVVANISLTSPVPAGTTVELSWATQNNPTQTILTVASVPSGATVTSINFFAPSDAKIPLSPSARPFTHSTSRARRWGVAARLESGTSVEPLAI